jgi:hypothetical protein
MTTLPVRQVGSTTLKVTTLGLGGVAIGDFFEFVPEDRAHATVEAAYWMEFAFTIPRRSTGMVCRSTVSAMSFVESPAGISSSAPRSGAG